MDTATLFHPFSLSSSSPPLPSFDIFLPIWLLAGTWRRREGGGCLLIQHNTSNNLLLLPLSLSLVCVSVCELTDNTAERIWGTVKGKERGEEEGEKLRTDRETTLASAITQKTSTMQL